MCAREATVRRGARCRRGDADSMGSWCLRFPRCLGGVSTATALWPCGAMVFVVAASGLPLPMATPVRPLDHRLLIGVQRGGQGGVQVLDLGHSERDQLLTGVAAPFWPRLA